MRKTANWDTDIGLNFTLSEFEVNNMMVEKLANKTMRVVTTPNDPYVMEKESATKLNIETRNRLSFLERYEGFCVDLIKELAKVVRIAFRCNGRKISEIIFPGEVQVQVPDAGGGVVRQQGPDDRPVDGDDQGPEDPAGGHGRHRHEHHLRQADCG